MLLIFSLTLTVVVLRQPKGPQPAAYGHVQTLANLIDEWSPTMWWGHKKNGYTFYHAGECLGRSFALSVVDRLVGTSDCRLSNVNMEALYA